VAALSHVREIVQSVEAEAETLARKWLIDTRIARNNLTDEHLAANDLLDGMFTRPERLTLTKPITAQNDAKQIAIHFLRPRTVFRYLKTTGSNSS